MAQTLKFGNGTWATKKGSTLAYNDLDGNFKPLPFTYTGAGKGTRVNKEGLIEVVENDRPRIDYKDSEDGVFLLEKAATNYVINSSDASSWSNVISGGTVTKTGNYAISPDGTQTATRLQASVSGSGYALITLANTTSFFGDYTATVYVKSNTENNQDIVFYGRNTDVDKHTVTGEWTRIEFKGSSTSGQTNYAYIGISTGIREEDNPIDILVWGGQLESGNATSYIPTQGTTVTRVAETASGSGNSEVFSDSQGVLFANIAANADDLTFRLISLSDGTTSNRISLGYRTTSNAIYCEIRNSNVTQAFLITTINDIKTKSKVSVKYKENDFALWVNGFEVSTDTSGITPINLSKINFDSGQQSGGFFYGKTKEIAYYDEILTDLELETLTSYRTWEAMVKELNLNIIHNE